MPNTHDFPFTPLFVHPIRLRRDTPVFHTASTDEVEYPYRYSKSLVFRIRGRGLVIGWWRKTGRGEEEALLAAVNGRGDILETPVIRDIPRFDHDVSEPWYVTENYRFDEETDDITDHVLDRGAKFGPNGSC